MAHNGQTKSLGTVLFKVLRNPLASELTYEEAAEFALEYIRLLGAPLAYEDRVSEPIKIQSYKAELPCDLIHIRGVRYSNCGFDNNPGFAMRYASDTFHLAQDKTTFDRTPIEYGEHTYTIQKGILFSSLENGEIQIAYKAVMTDEEGYPLIPDDSKVILGLEYFILHRYLEPFWLMGKITDKAFHYITQQRDWYIGAADASLRSLSPDQMETVMNTINRLIINTTAHKDSFKNLGVKEVLKRQR